MFSRKEQPAASPAVQPALSPALQAAIQKLESATADRDKIQSAIDKARADCRDLAVGVEETRAKLTAGEVESALQGAAVDAKTRKAFSDLQNEREFAEARVTGLQ